LITESVVEDAQARLDRLMNAIARLAPKTSIVLALPALPLAPVLHTPGSELHPVEAQLKAMIYAAAASTPAVVLHPGHLLATAHDLRSELMTGLPYSFAYADEVAAALVRAALPEPPKKGLISDLDETMWSGVLGDDGPDRVSWDLDNKTAFHGMYQELLNSLAEAGVLIGIASKNDEVLVARAFERSDLVIKPERIFPIEAHWKPKAESVERTLDAWNIAPESVVFVDDNPLELEQIKTAFPDMECVRFRKDDPSFLSELRDHFGKRAILEEDLLRAGSLRTGRDLRHAATNIATLDTLLAGANAKIVFRWGKQPDQRALELINKTNQFNLNGVRYTEADWKRFLSDPTTHMATVEYADRFGKLGKIAVIAGREQDGRFSVETWVMSCRAFSRRVEYQCLKVLLDRWDSITLRLRRTDRNGPLQDFVTQIGVGELITRAQFDHSCPQLFHETESLNV
jgi:FkbH-like protein